MEIENYNELPPGKSVIAEFSVYLPGAKMRIHKMKVLKNKHGGKYVGFPAYGVEQDDGRKKWMPFLEFTEEKAKEFQEKVLEALKPFMRE